MNKKIIIFGVCLILLVVLVSSGVHWIFQEENIFDECQHLNDDEQESCIEEIYLSLNSVEDCKEINNVLFRQKCIVDLSKKSTDLSVCDSVDDRDKTQCLNDIYTNIAIEKNDSSVCNNLNHSLFIRSCINKLAVLNRDLDLCTFNDEIYQYGCEELVVKQIAIDKNDTTICDEFEFQGDKYTEPWVPQKRCIEQAAFCNLNKNLCTDLSCEERIDELIDEEGFGGFCELFYTLG